MTRELIDKANALLHQINELQETKKQLELMKSFLFVDDVENPCLRAILPSGLEQAQLSDAVFDAILYTAIDVITNQISDLEDELRAL